MKIMVHRSFGIWHYPGVVASLVEAWGSEAQGRGTDKWDIQTRICSFLVQLHFAIVMIESRCHRHLTMEANMNRIAMMFCAAVMVPMLGGCVELEDDPYEFNGQGYYAPQNYDTYYGSYNYSDWDDAGYYGGRDYNWRGRGYGRGYRDNNGWGGSSYYGHSDDGQRGGAGRYGHGGQRGGGTYGRGERGQSSVDHGGGAFGSGRITRGNAWQLNQAAPQKYQAMPQQSSAPQQQPSFDAGGQRGGGQGGGRVMGGNFGQSNQASSLPSPSQVQPPAFNGGGQGPGGGFRNNGGGGNMAPPPQNNGWNPFFGHNPNDPNDTN